MYHHSDNNDYRPTAFPDISPYCWPFESTVNDNNDVMRFNGIPTIVSPPPPQIASTSGINLINHPPRTKRKNDDPNLIPSKQLITEEKMIKHLHGLHISNDFQAHNINLDNDPMEETYSYTVNLSPEELQQRLKNASCIQLHEDVKKSLEESNKNEIYKVLSSRIEKPCQALILWQPPASLDRLITDFKTNKDSEDGEEECEKMVE
ncbi:hypothetical protein PVAND_009715 [Polypedilum vanderplanki]|uniref:Uncharacterized protein n=1 Tax=Polypedilum vanderplanki TaxID=319348 RepID=A0A9J6CEY9_POLVA|nr:hypothetical protein PVAND_009715 [Polypedilum vanderplanki]